MNTCSLEKLIIPYGKGELSVVESARVAAHLDVCDSCRETLSLVRSVESLADSYQRPPVPQEVRKAYYGTLEQQFPVRKRVLLQWKYNPDRVCLREQGLLITVAVTVIVMAVIAGKYVKKSSPEMPLVVPSTTIVIQREDSQVQRFLQSAEIVLLDLKNGSGQGISREIVREAQKLIERIPLIHDIAMEEGNTGLLSFLVQSELILYEAANYRDGSPSTVLHLIQKGAGSKRLWEALGTVRKTMRHGSTVIMNT